MKLLMRKSAADTTASTAKAEFSCFDGKPKWLVNPATDFFLIHGGLGLLSLPVVACAYLLPADLSEQPFLLAQLLLNKPHLAATYQKIVHPETPPRQRELLVYSAPVIFALVFIAIAHFELLPCLTLLALLIQTWHVNRQNFGILRKYQRQSSSNTSCGVNRSAEFAMEIIPWACLIFACSNKAPSFLGQPIFLPSELFTSVFAIAWPVAVLSGLAYLVFEFIEWRRRKILPGRFLCVSAACLINALAWLLIQEISWAFLIVTIWHTVQYMFFTFLSENKTVFTTLPRRQAILFWLRMFLLGLSFYIALFAANKLGYAAISALSLTITLHHQISDSFIWRRRKSTPAAAIS